MNLRDRMFLIFGIGAGLLGIVGTITWSLETGVVALIVISLVILVLLVLQRRQLARVQQRTLTMLNAQQTMKPVVGQEPQESIAIPTKKILGLLQAQQVSIDLINDKIEAGLDKSPDRSERFN